MSSAHQNTNKIIDQNVALLDLATRDDIGALLRELDYNWAANKLNPDARIVPVFDAHGFLERNNSALSLNKTGQLYLGRLLLHFDDTQGREEVFGSLAEKYKDFKVISSGKNSIVLTARHRLLDTIFVLKLVRPGASINIAESMRLLSKLPADTSIVRPIDFISTEIPDVLGHIVSVPCIVFPFAEGITFREFLLQSNHHLNSQVVMAFARQVGSALLELEVLHAYHGDLHEGNIIVDQYADIGLRFKIVDISFDAMGSLPFEECRNNDLANFKQHIWKILSVQRSFLPRLSIRKHVGTQTFLRVQRILSENTSSFADVCKALDDDVDYQKFLREKSKFISTKFSMPASFRLQRYEEITDPTIAVKLFVPFEQLMDKIRAFGNIYVSGNRGSGKSTYLASLAFLPDAGDAIVEFNEIFGIYFPCRQGEFRPLTARPGWNPALANALVTDIIIIKVVRRVLETLASGLRSGKLQHPRATEALRKFVERFLPSPALVFVDRAIQTETENMATTMVRLEMEAIGRLGTGELSVGPRRSVGDLLEFFSVVRGTFDELATTRFHLLFDDAGVPYVPDNVQRIINDLMISSNALFCVKISAEKLTFTFQCSDGKVLESGQDYFEHDISQILFIGSGGGLERSVLEDYFRRIVEQRLVHFDYQSHDIIDYVGDDQLSVDGLLNLLARGRKDAYYCGWTTIWNIADRTPRNLLEIVSEIFSVGNVDQSSLPNVVSKRKQDRAIRTISEKRLESLSQIAGFITIMGQRTSLGRSLFETTAAIGSTFRRYLVTEVGRKHKRQHLAIERNDFGPLSPEAEVVLRRLITFGVLDAGKAGFARDDNVKKPFYVLNRIYCPAFAIGYRRDDHLRLSRGKLEMLLLAPQDFVREGTKRLRTDGDVHGRDLFDYKRR